MCFGVWSTGRVDDGEAGKAELRLCMIYEIVSQQEGNSRWMCTAHSVLQARKRVLRSMRTADEAHRYAALVLREGYGVLEEEEQGTTGGAPLPPPPPVNCFLSGHPTFIPTPSRVNFSLVVVARWRVQL